MKTTGLFLLALAMMVSFFSCKKDKDENPSPTPTVTIPKIKTITDSTTNEIDTYYYNNSGKIIKVKYSDNSYDTVIYTNNKVHFKFFNELNQLAGELLLNLNANGLATNGWFLNYGSKVNKSVFSKILVNPSSVKTNDTMYYTFQYNSNGYLTQQTITYNNINNTYTFNYDSNGNLSSISSNSNTTTYEYFTDKINTIGDHNKGVTYFGKQSKNLIKSSTTNNTYTVYYSYEISNNKVVKERQFNNYFNNTLLYTYY